MPPHVFQSIAEMVIVATTLLGMAGVASWTILRLRQPRPGAPQSRDLAGLEERLARLEQAVDAVAVEVERSGEAQRFTARLLADRLTDGAPGSGGARGTERLAERAPERQGAARPTHATPH